jgi:hypothetical protein
VSSASTSAATWTVTPGGQYRAQVRDDNFWGILDVRINQEIHARPTTAPRPFLSFDREIRLPDRSS